MSNKSAVTYLEKSDWKRSRLGLERSFELLSRLDNPQKNLKFVHIAGTNGKGSTAAMLSSILNISNLTIGLYTSPYLFCFNERMQVNGKNITDEELNEVTELVKMKADKMEDHPTEFELITAVALLWFKKKKCDIVVLEVGLGGRLDSTNVIDAPLVAVITNIGLDHTEYLGNTLEKIACEKAGIIKPNSDVVVCKQENEVLNVIKKRCKDLSCPLFVANYKKVRLLNHNLQGQEFDFGELKRLHMPLLGNNQLKNVSIVLTVIECLRKKGYKITDENIRQGLSETFWPGRFEIINSDPIFVLDGGHNPQCAESLIQNLKDYFPHKDIVFLLGMLKDKDIENVLKIIIPFAKKFVTITPNSQRAMPADKLAQIISSYNNEVIAAKSVSEGVKKAISAAKKDNLAICAFGSLYTIGEIRNIFRLY